AHVGQLREPPQRQSREQLALARDARFEHVIEGAHPVARDHEHEPWMLRRLIQVTHLARVGALPSARFAPYAGCVRRSHPATRAAMSVRKCPPSSRMVSSAAYAFARACAKSGASAITLSTRPPVATSSSPERAVAAWAT